MKVLVIEDDKKISSFIRNGLRSEGHTVDVAFDGEDGLYLATEGRYDIIVLDLMLPEIDGITLCQRLRKVGNKTPLIMLTAKDAVEDRVQGLDAGADDYLTKPFSFTELTARIRALSRRGQPESPAVFKVGDLSLAPDSHEVKRGKKEIALSATEFRLLHYLMQNKGRVLSKALILENVWGYDFSPESNIVDVYIKYLRDKIDRGSKNAMIQTVHGVGYKLCE